MRWRPTAGCSIRGSARTTSRSSAIRLAAGSRSPQCRRQQPSEAIMRRIVESTLLSLNGVIGDPHLWASERFDDEARAGALAQLRASDAMLMGRHTYEIFAALWPGQTGDYPDAINGIRKYVFSSTLEQADWDNSTIVRG